MATSARPVMAVGKRSGKRTLTEVMDDEIAAKQKKQEQEDAAAAAAAGLDTVTPRVPTTSRFFRVAQRSVSDPRGDRLGWGRPVAQTVSSPSLDHDHPRRGRGQQELVAGSSGLSQREKEKENVQPGADDEVVDADADMEMEMGVPDAVTQEDGYASPTESVGQWDSPNISSPVRPGAERHGGGREDDEEEEHDADVLSSSPVAHARTSMSTRNRSAVVVERVVTRALPLRPVLNTSFSQRKRARSRSRSCSRSRTRRKPFGGSGEEDNGAGEVSCGEASVAGRDGPDLRRTIFDEFDDIHDWDEITSGGEDGEDEDTQGFVDEDVMFWTTSSTPGMITPTTDGDDIEYEGETPAILLDEGSSEELEDHRHSGAASLAAQNAMIAHGWWERWARSGSSAHARGQGANTNSRSNAVASAGSNQVCLSLPSILLALSLGH